MIDEYGVELQSNLVVNIIIGVLTLIGGIAIGYFMDLVEAKYDKM
jgi:uncharacterized protein YneF (UPF0154 family)